MTCNMGGGDRVVRGILGVLILAAGLYFQSWWGLIGLIPLGTAAVGFCPAYLPFGISTGGRADS
jgi:hypothetical protein